MPPPEPPIISILFVSTFLKFFITSIARDMSHMRSPINVLPSINATCASYSHMFALARFLSVGLLSPMPRCSMASAANPRFTA